MKNAIKKQLSILAVAISFILLITIIGSLIYSRSVDARMNNSDQVVVQSAVEDNVATHLSIDSLTVATGTILVDLSDVTNYPHYMNAGVMEIAQIRIDYTSDVIASTTLQFGVLASSTSAGDYVDVYWFDKISFSVTGTSGDEHESAVLDYSPSVMKLNLSSGAPASFITDDSELWTTLFATTSPISSPNGKTGPGVGDLIMRVNDQKGTATTSVTTIYRIKP